MQRASCQLLPLIDASQAHKADARTVCKLRPKVILSENLNNPDKVKPDVIGPDCPAELDGRENVRRIPNVGAPLVDVHQSVQARSLPTRSSLAASVSRSVPVPTLPSRGKA